MIEQKTINICVISYDDYFIKYFGSMICSLLGNIDKTYHVNIFFIHNGISIHTTTKIEKFIAHYNAEINFVHAPEDTFKVFPRISPSRYVIYYRLKIGELLPKDRDKVIFLDCDIIVPGDISKMWNIDIKDHIVGAVKDCINWSKKTSSKLENYFNAGVLLVDLKKRREEKIGDKVLAYMDENHTNMSLGEQDGLNKILDKKWHHIHPRYNYLNINFSYKESQYTQREVREAKKNPIIIHYAGSQHRPRGGRLCVHPKWPLYYYYIFKTPRRDWSDVYKIPLRIISSNPLTYWMYKTARSLIHK